MQNSSTNMNQHYTNNSSYNNNNYNNNGNPNNYNNSIQNNGTIANNYNNYNNNGNGNIDNSHPNSKKQRTDTLDKPPNSQPFGMERAASTSATPRAGVSNLTIGMPIPSEAPKIFTNQSETNNNTNNNDDNIEKSKDSNALSTPRIVVDGSSDNLQEIIEEMKDKTTNDINADIQATPGHTPRVVMSASAFNEDINSMGNVLSNLSGSEEDLLYGNFDATKFDPKKLEQLKKLNLNTSDIMDDNIDLI